MTQPQQLIAPGPIDQGDNETAADRLSRIIAGNKNLVTHPHLVSALYSTHASEAQAGAINQFVGGLMASGRVEVARQQGVKINLSSQELSGLNALGVDYDDVQLTAQDFARQIAAQQKKQQALVKNAQEAEQRKKNVGGATDAELKAAVNRAIGHNAADSIGDHLSEDVVDPVVDGMNKAWHWTESTVVDIGKDFSKNVLGLAGAQNGGQGPAGPNGPSAGDIVQQKIKAMQDSERRAMKAAGYDPDSTFSREAYKASGKAVTDLSDLYYRHDPDMVDEAIRFSEDPKKYVQDVVGNTDLTPEQVGNRLNQLQGKEFQNLVTRVNARKATPGNVLTSFIDPTEHPDIQRFTAAGIDLAFSFVLDPTLMAFAGAKAAKATQLALDGTSTAADADKVRRILLGAEKGIYAGQVRRGMQSFLDSTAMIRHGVNTGDDAAAAAGYAKLRAETPALEHLAPDFLGGTRAVAFQDVEGGNLALRYEKAEPITTMEQAADYLASTVGLVRLRAGRPLAESSLMPGQLSSFGYKKLRGNLAAGAAYSGVKRDSRLVFDLRHDAGRILPTEDDAVDVVTGKVLAAQKAVEQSELLASKFAAESQAASAAERSALARGKRSGKWDPNYSELQSVAAQSRTVADNAASQLATDRAALDAAKAEATSSPLPSAVRGEDSRQFGEALHDSRRGITGSANRGRLLAQRFTSFLPRATTFATDDPTAVQNVFRYGKMYLTNGRANLLAAAYAAGDEGARKAILNGMELQTLHAAGLGRTEAGRAMISNAEKALDEGHRYASHPDGIDKVVDPLTGDNRAVALWESQVNPKVTLSGFRDIQRAAAKIGIWEATLGRAFNAQLTDNLMGIVKPGWLTTGTNVARNAGEDLFGAAVRGEYGDVSRAKAVAESNGLLPSRTKLGNIVAAPLARVAHGYRHLKVNTADEKLGLKYIAALDKETTHAIADDWMNLHRGSMIDPAGARDVDLITQAGFVPQRLRFDRRYGEAVVSEDMRGAETLANALAPVIEGNADRVRAILTHMRDPEGIPLEKILEQMADPKNSKRLNQMTRAGMFKDENGTWHRAVTKEDRELANRQTLSLQMKELSYLLQGRDGTLNSKLVDHILETGKAPDSRWIMENLTGAERPLTVNAPMFEAAPLEGGVTGFVGAIGDVAGRGYKYLVERPIARISSMPIFLSHYGKARFDIRAIEDEMVKGGMSAEAADRSAQAMAMEMAFNRTLKYIDDPTTRTQMDIVGRNFFAFSRATQAFIRRWGTQLIEDPTRLRKAMLTMEAGQSAGLVYEDENGDKQFMFPGSGAAIEAFAKLGSVLPGVDLVRVPGVSADFSGKVMLLQPGLQNPLQMSMTPIVNIPMRAVFSLFPEHRQMLDEVDAFLNGRAAQGGNLLDEITPTAVKKFTQALSDDDKDSMLASSSRQAILALAAAGKLPKADADAAQRDEFLQNLRAQTKNHLVARAIFGYFSPTPPGLEQESDGSQSDWYYRARGIHGLDSEFKALLNDTGGDYGRAAAIWAQIHPDKTFYMTGTTKSPGGKNLTIQATRSSQRWLEDHIDFMKDYKGVSAYFIPRSTQQGDFDLGAYNAQLETGLREHKDLSEFYADVRVKGAQDLFFKSIAQRDAAIEADPDSKTQVMAAFSQWSKEFRSLNPLFGATTYADQVNTATNQLATLRRLIRDKPGGIGDLTVVGNMVKAYDTYHQRRAAITGSSNWAEAQRKYLASEYADWMKKAATDHPQFAALYQGVFRTLDSRVLEQLEALQ